MLNVEALKDAGFTRTCSVDKPVDGGVVLALREEHVVKIQNTDARVFVIVPLDLRSRPKMVTLAGFEGPDNAMVGGHPGYASRNPQALFAQIHHELLNGWRHRRNNISKSAYIHPTAVIGSDGAKVVRDPMGRIYHFEHVGIVEIGPGVWIGPNVCIQRAVFDETVVNKECHIGPGSSIGHNTIMQEQTILAANVTISGSCNIGSRCYIGSGAVFKEHITICDYVLIGAGAVVVKNIYKPGKYAGNPARYLGEWGGKW